MFKRGLSRNSNDKKKTNQRSEQYYPTSGSKIGQTNHHKRSPTPRLVWVRHLLPPAFSFSGKNYNQILESFYSHSFFRRDIKRLRKNYPKCFWSQIIEWQQEANKLSSEVRQHLSTMNKWQTLHKKPQYYLLRPPSVELAIDSDIESFCSDWGLFIPRIRNGLNGLFRTGSLTFLARNHLRSLQIVSRSFIHGH